MGHAHLVHAFRRGPPQREVVPTPSPAASEFVLRASILHIEKFQARSRISAAPTDRLVGRVTRGMSAGRQ